MPITRESWEKRWTLRQVDVWGPDQIRENCDVTVVDGKVESIRPASESESGSRLALIPAGVDTQVHLRVPGQREKETPLEGLTAALYGGFGAVLTMPNTRPVIDSVDVVEAARAELAPAESETGVQAFLSAAITMGQKGETLTPMEALWKAGVVAFTDDGVGVASDERMKQALERSSDLGGAPLLQHAEVPGHGGVLAPGPVQAKLGVKAYSPSQEVDMVARDIRLLSEVPKARYHVLHLSSAGSLDPISKGKEQGLGVSCEVSPHHLWFTCGDLNPQDSSFKMNPPIRSDKDRVALQKGLETGLVDWVATDHAPHEPGAKGLDFSCAAFGTTGLETCLRVLLGLWKAGSLSASRLVQVFSSQPAEFLGLRGEGWGQIQEGEPLRAVFVDTAFTSEIQERDLKSHSHNNCFVGQSLPGKLLAQFQPSGIYILANDFDL